MRNASFMLSTSLSQKFQIMANKPNIAVYVRQRFWDDPDRKADISSGIHPDQEWYQLTNRALSVEIQESTDQFASSFTVVMTDEEGEISPDNYPLKWPLSMKFRGHQLMAYQQQLLPNNEVMIYAGYGEHLIRVIHGFIEDTSISSDGSTISISCMTSYKQVLHQTAEKTIKTPTGNLFDVLKFIFNLAGVELRGSKMLVPGTTEEWTIKTPIVIEKGQAYDEPVRNIIDTTFHHIRANEDGSCELITIPRYTERDEFNVTFSEEVNLTVLDYKATDRDVYSGVTVKCGNHVNSWYNGYLLREVALGRFKEEIIDCPWANTFMKRKEVASAAHLRNLYKWRTVTAGVVGDPRLQLWDRARVSEHVTSATRVYHINGINTMLSAAGYFQVIDMANVYDYRPLPYNRDESALKPGTSRIGVVLNRKVAEHKPDTVNVYANDKLIASIPLGTTPTTTWIDLPVGDSYVTVEGVTCKNAKVQGHVKIINYNNVVLKQQDFEFAKSGVNKHLVYEKRPFIAFTLIR